MSVKKYSVLTIGLYVLIFLSPLLFATFHAQAWGVIISYLLGAILMIAMYLKQTSFLSFEKKQPNWLLVILLGVLGIFGSIILQILSFKLKSYLDKIQSPKIQKALYKMCWLSHSFSLL